METNRATEISASDNIPTPDMISAGYRASGFRVNPEQLVKIYVAMREAAPADQTPKTDSEAHESVDALKALESAHNALQRLLGAYSSSHHAKTRESAWEQARAAIDLADSVLSGKK